MAVLLPLPERPLTRTIRGRGRSLTADASPAADARPAGRRRSRLPGAADARAPPPPPPWPCCRRDVREARGDRSGPPPATARARRPGPPPRSPPRSPVRRGPECRGCRDRGSPCGGGSARGTGRPPGRPRPSPARPRRRPPADGPSTRARARTRSSRSRCAPATGSRRSTPRGALRGPSSRAPPDHPSRSPTPLELLVLVLDRADHFRRAVGLAEPLAEGRVPEEPGDARECLEIAPSGMLRDDEEEEVVGGLTVDRVEVHALVAAGEARQEPIEADELPVGN